MYTAKVLLWANGMDISIGLWQGDRVLVWGKQVLLRIFLIPTSGYLPLFLAQIRDAGFVLNGCGMVLVSVC